MTGKMMKLGVVTTGHGPREEYVHYHAAVLRGLGAEVEVVTRHALEGLSIDQLTPHQVGKEKPNLGAHVHVPGATGNHMGDGWEHRFYDLDFAIGRMQRAIDLLETEDSADLVLLACAAEFPEGALSARTILVHPRALLFSLVENLAHGSCRKIRIGVMVDAEHADHDRADWERRPWFGSIHLELAPIHGHPQAAAEALGRAGVDYAFIFGYGVGLAPFDRRDDVTRLERAIGAPLILPHRVTALHLRSLIGPPIDDHDYLPNTWGLK